MVKVKKSEKELIEGVFAGEGYMCGRDVARHLEIALSTMWLLVKQGRFPKTVKRHGGRKGFDIAHIRAWLVNGRSSVVVAGTCANQVNIVQLISLIEAGQFPIGVDFTDPLARRLYDACSVLMCHASISGRQASIARRHINTAMSEMGNNQGGYYHLKKCLEEMNAQEQGETPSVVLCQQYSAELTECLAEFGSINSLVTAMRGSAKRLAELGLSDEAEEMGDGALVIKALLEFLSAPSRSVDAEEAPQ